MATKCIWSLQIWYTHLHSNCLELYCFSCHGWELLAPWWPQTFGKGISVELPATGKFSELLSTCFEIWTWNLVYTFGRWHDRSSLSFITISSLPLESSPEFFFKCFEVSTWKLVYILSRLHNIVHVSPEWGPCDLPHVLSLGTVNLQGIHWFWQRGELGNLWLLLFIKICCLAVYKKAYRTDYRYISNLAEGNLILEYCYCFPLHFIDDDIMPMVTIWTLVAFYSQWMRN